MDMTTIDIVTYVVLAIILLLAVSTTVATIIFNKKLPKIPLQEKLSSNGCTISILFFTSIILLIAQLSFSYYVPDDSAWKKSFSVGLNVIPIILSIILCQIYWGKLKEDIANKIFDSIYPTLMVAQGTFYTFVGVSAILLSYKASGSSTGVTMLIGGLKLAFLTSVVGILYSIAAKIYIKEKMDSNKSHISNPVYHDEEDFYRLFVSMSKTLSEIKEQSAKTEDRVQAVINKTSENNMQLSQYAMNALITQSEKSLNLITNKMMNVIDNSLNKIDDRIEHITNEFDKTIHLIGEMNLNINQTSANMQQMNKVSSEYLKILISNKNTILSQYQASIKMLDEIFVQLSKQNELLGNIDYGSLKQFEENIFAFSAAIAKYKQLTEDNIDNMNKMLSNSIANSDKTLAMGANELNKHINLLNDSLKINTENVGKIIYQELDKMQKDFAKLEGQLKETAEQSKNYTNRADLTINTLTTVDEQIPQCLEKIANQFKRLGENQINLNSQFNDKLIAGQQRYIDNLNDLLAKSVGVIGDIIQKTRDESIKLLSDLQANVEKERLVNSKDEDVL